MSSLFVMRAADRNRFRSGSTKSLKDLFWLCKEAYHLVHKVSPLPISVSSSIELFHRSSTDSYTDRDGTMDMILTTCKSVSSSGVGSDCYINIAYNQQLPLCSYTTDSGMKNGVRVCRPPNDLCTADDNFQFNLLDSPDNNVSSRLQRPFHTLIQLYRLLFAFLFHPFSVMVTSNPCLFGIRALIHPFPFHYA